MFEQLPELCESSDAGYYNTPEVGLFWAIDPEHQRQGYATEAAKAMIDHAFEHMHLKRILATTEFSNIASQGVMRKLGMQLARNSSRHPSHLEIVGILLNPGGHSVIRT